MEGSQSASAFGTTNAAGDEGMPFTVQQRYFWDRSGGDDALYTLIPFPFLLLGPLDPERIRSSIQRLVDRHDALRTRVIPAAGALPRQRFLAPAAYPLEIVDLSDPAKAESEIDEKLQSELHARFKRRIVLETDSLFETTLFRLAAERHALVFRVHHLLSDGHTPSLLAQDLWTLYAGGMSAEAQGEPLQYSQYCAWQQEVLEGWLNEQKPYWTRRLSGARPIQWPEISGAPLEPHGLSEGASCTVDAATTANLRARARRSRKQLSLYALTAYAAAVRDWCNQSDFVLAVSMTGRLAKEHLSVIGFLMQPLYLRVQTTPGAGFESLLDTIGKEYLGALFHGDFGQTVLENPALGASTLFQWFPADWRLTPAQSLNLRFRVEPLAFKHRGFFHEKFKLGVFVYETADQLSIRGSFRPDCVRRSVVERLLEQIRGQLEQQATNGP